MLPRALRERLQETAMTTTAPDRNGDSSLLAAEFDTAKRDDQVRGAVCQCVVRLADNLKPAYTEALRCIEIQGVAVKDYAVEVGMNRTGGPLRQAPPAVVTHVSVGLEDILKSPPRAMPGRQKVKRLQGLHDGTASATARLPHETL